MGTKPGPKPTANLGTRGATVVMYKGERRRIIDIAAENGLTTSILRDRWRRAGSPKEIDESLLHPKGVNPSAYTVTLMPDGLKMTPYKLADMFNMNHNTIAYRVRKGQLVFTREELEEITKHTKARFTIRTTDHYNDPSYLPHIKKGDLAHLSGTANFGRGKGEIPDEQWIALTTSEKRRQPMSIETLLRFSSSSSTCFNPE